MTTLAVYSSAGASWRLEEVDGSIALQRRADDPEWVTVLTNVGEPAADTYATVNAARLVRLKSLVDAYLATAHLEPSPLRPSVDVKFTYIDEAKVFTPEEFSAARAWQSRVHTAARRTVPLLDLCTEIETAAGVAASASPGLWRHHPYTPSYATIHAGNQYPARSDQGRKVSQASPIEFAKHIEATQPLVILALVAKLREAQELLVESMAVAGRRLDDWRLQGENPAATLGRLQDRIVQWHKIEVP